VINQLSHCNNLHSYLQDNIITKRQADYEFLGTIADIELENIDRQNYTMVEQFLDNDWSIAQNDWGSEEYDWRESPNSSEDTSPISPSSEGSPLKLTTNNYRARAQHYEQLANASDNLAIKELYTQAQRINQRASSPDIFSFLGALLSYNSHKVSFTDKATHLNQAIDKLGKVDKTSFTLEIENQSSEIYMALNETTMTHVKKTTAIQKIEQALEQEQDKSQFQI